MRLCNAIACIKSWTDLCKSMEDSDCIDVVETM